jgi:hypothetical protein
MKKREETFSSQSDIILIKKLFSSFVVDMPVVFVDAMT